ncbi:MAG: JAB domain-containing protein [Candidatus Spechtbacteria bacterium SB0662_bin_43]|uniref:JAB domain-containing protein n=1 Tax=Candidatus Spechtbacteria bacterium SB0662_bin_43 TaxID=2604897 RepID=A0A845DDF7_9BACT|nr:JAB domain-containing protein [Candidatus Spechtbacteria bacterium SB0662_bin_43]
MGKIQEIPASERPQEKLEKYGAARLRDEELMAIILRSGVQGKNAVALSREVLNIIDNHLNHGINDLKDFPNHRLEGIKGMGKVKQAQINAMIELTYRFGRKEYKDVVLASAEDVAKACVDFRDSRKEHMAVFYLTTRLQVIKREIISIGIVDATIVHPREVFEHAIRVSAHSIIITHNHPSGNADPSQADIQLTRRLKEAGRVVGIEVQDHIIITKTEYKSMKDEGLL